MEALCSTETSVSFCWIVWHHIPEHSNVRYCYSYTRDATLIEGQEECKRDALTHNLEIKSLLSKEEGDGLGGGGEDTEEEKANEEGRGKEGEWSKLSIHTNVSP